MMKTTISCLALIYLLFQPNIDVKSATIILTSDQQLNDLLDPDKVIDLSTGFNKRSASLRQICEKAEAAGDHVLTIAFDEFFRQYREHAGTDRKLTPDMDEYVQKIKVIADFAAGYGLSMGLSLLSPLELGPAFKNQIGKSGKWLHYKVGLRDPVTGKFSVPLWQQHYWTNNKGKFGIKLKDYKAYAFKEQPVARTSLRAVDRRDILPLDEVSLDHWGNEEKTSSIGMETGDWSAPSNDGNTSRVGATRVSIHSDGSKVYPGYDKVLVVLEYEVPEMAYFSPEAYPFLQGLLKKYADNGIHIEHLYSDEMHIQQDWYYFNHHDNGQFSLRYYTEDLGRSYQESYGVPFEEKDILYFGYGPDIDGQTVMAGQHIQYVMGESVSQIQQTFLFRDRYYKLLNQHVVDLFKRAKTYASTLFGVEDFGTRGHASWAESPTVDYWKNSGLEERHAYKYEYTPDFVWGNTVQQAAAACYDYFKWGEYLEPTRNDFGELGWNDRNYYGAAMAASVGVVNRIPNAYPAVWGMPAAVKERKLAINDAYGGRPRSASIDLITGHVHRDVDVLILYPMNLVAVEERFGSWMTQYGYANFITAEKLLELGQITDQGELVVGNKRYTTLVAMFEPLPQEGLLTLMDELVQQGGKSVWFGPPAIIDGAGKPCLNQWQDIFGVTYHHQQRQGLALPGRKIQFKHALSEVPAQYILTDFLVDHIYPVLVHPGSHQLAVCGNEHLVGTRRDQAYFFGFRPRDDQSASLGYETRTLFEILDQIGAYPATGTFPEINDNPEHISRTSDYLATRFPNGATVIVRHYRQHRETWPGGFSRDPVADSILLLQNPLPSDEIDLHNFAINGHLVDFVGRLTVAFRMNNEDELVAFEGQSCDQITIDGNTQHFADSKLKKIAFAPSLTSEDELEIYVDGNGMVKIPLPTKLSGMQLTLTSSSDETMPATINDGKLHFMANDRNRGKWLRLALKK